MFFRRGLNLLFPFFMHLHMWLVDETPPGVPNRDKKKKRKINWANIIIALVLIFVCVIAILTLLGPTTGLDHSDVIKNL